MKTCEVCRRENEADAETCLDCGEASWSTVAAPKAEEPKNDAPKAKRR